MLPGFMYFSRFERDTCGRVWSHSSGSLSPTRRSVVGVPRGRLRGGQSTTCALPARILAGVFEEGVCRFAREFPSGAPWVEQTRVEMPAPRLVVLLSAVVVPHGKLCCGAVYVRGERTRQRPVSTAWSTPGARRPLVRVSLPFRRRFCLCRTPFGGETVSSGHREAVLSVERSVDPHPFGCGSDHLMPGHPVDGLSVGTRSPALACWSSVGGLVFVVLGACPRSSLLALMASCC